MKFFAGLTLLAAVASALPSPQFMPRAEQKCDNPGRIVSVVIDSSGSNAQTDRNNLRLAGSKDLINYLTSSAEATATNKADRIAVVGFDLNAQVHYPMGDPNAQAINAVNKVRASGGTSVYKGVAEGLNQVVKTGNVDGRGGIVVFTDGQDYNKKQLIQVINDAKNKGVRVSLGHLNPKIKGTNKSLLGDLIDALFGQGGGTDLDAGVSAAVQATGGTAATINSAAAQQAFLQAVIKNGITNNDGKCSGNDVGDSGGPIVDEVSVGGLCTGNSKAVFTYTGKTSESLDVTVALVSKSNPVQLVAELENKATGQKSQVTVNSGNPSQTLKGAAAQGQEVTVTITPSGADDSQTCQYTVLLNVTPNGNVPSSSAPPVVSSSAPPVVSSSAPPVVSSSAPPVVSSSAPPVVSSSAPPVVSSSAPPVVSSSAPPVVSSSAPPVVSSSAPPVVSSSAPPVVSSSAPPVVSSSAPPVVSSSAPPVVSSSAPPVVSSSAPPVVSSSAPPVVSSSAPPVVSSSAPPPVSSSAPPVISSSACPTVGAPQTVVTTVTKVETITAQGPAPSAAPPVTVTTTITEAPPQPTASVCLCKCDTPGAKPLPKFEL